ncbi:MAG: hypothetical protein ACTSPV_00035 [Candidatus Hodarchaeales archaeon]
MKGIQPTNPYDDRVLRIFSTGKEFHHLLCKVFEKIGVLQEKEKRVEIPENKEMLPIVGYFDMKLGGFTNWNEARKRVKEYGFSEFVEAVSLKIIDNLEKEYPKGLTPLIAEIKSVNSNAFWAKKDYIGSGYLHHKLQLYTYLIATGIEEGRLFYISKDDLTLQEGIIFLNDQNLRKMWEEDVKTMTNYYRKDIVPPKEPDIIFNETKHKYEINWRIARSLYLTKITGKTKKEWEKEVKKELRKKNQLLKGRKS